MKIIRVTRSVTRPYGAGFWFDELSANATVDAGSSAAVAQLVTQASAGTNLNSTTFTAEVTIVPADQPLVPVANSASGAQVAWCELGVPIPAGWQPTPDTLPNGHPGDCTGIFYQPDWVSPLDGSIQGRLYELWRMVETAGAWSCGWAHRDVNVNGLTEVWSRTWVTGPGGSYTTDPNSTYVDGYWTTGAGISLAPTLLTPDDCARGYADHALGLLVVSSDSPQVWPASKTDANSSTSLLREGQRLRLPSGYTIPSGLHPIAQVVAETAIRHGLVIVDQAGVVVVRATPSVKAAGYLNGTQEYQIFNGFPWADLQLLTPGTAANPVPTS